MTRANKQRFAKFLAVSVAISATILSVGTSNAKTLTIPGNRPFTLFVPTTYTSTTPAPLLIALHGYRQSGALLENYLHIQSIAQKLGILYVHPNGTADKNGNRFWNATPECCDFQSAKINDDAYIMSIIDSVSKRYSVDAKRIYLVGHSNGGFMVNELACAHADRIAAVVDIAGGSFTKPSMCKASASISVLQIWGSNDESFAGNHIQGKPIPGAIKTFTDWALINKCVGKPKVAYLQKDLDRTVSGLDTSISTYSKCPANTSIEFWKISGAGHVPNISATFTQSIITFLLDHPKT
ncbi:MAG: PHB depolymerase family esterase [Actinomycetes bacterium]